MLHLIRLSRMLKILFLISLLMQSVLVLSQTLVISANHTEGCAPLVVQFTCNMTGTYNWNFGNGNLSTIAAPIATFMSPGTYNVSLSVTDNGNVFTDLQTITVHQKPTANFGTQGGLTSGCVPLYINFLNGSSVGSGAIVSWMWNYGDGDSQTFTTGLNPQHEYTNAGNFNVTLQVTDVNGCSDSKTINNYIHASSGPVQLWYPSPNVFCEVPANVTIVNNTVGSNSYTWTTSTGLSSTLTAPNFIFNQPNTVITITLDASDNQGCTSTSSRTVTIGNVEALFSLPDVICRGESFIPDNQTIIGNQYSWNFNGITVIDDEPTIPCNTGGWNVITLTSSLDGDCFDSFTDSIYVEYVNANFVLQSPYICYLPTTQHLINTSYTNSLNGPYTSQWSLQWDGPSVEKSPAIDYTNQ